MDGRMTRITVYSFASIGSTLASVVGLAQTMIDPDNAWVPFGVLVGLVGMAVATTAKVVRLIDGINAEIKTAKREREKLAKAFGLDLNGDG